MSSWYIEATYTAPLEKAGQKIKASPKPSTSRPKRLPCYGVLASCEAQAR
jgi:hypothetical protein